MTLFTIEQLDLIRRLKATGITVELVHEAFAQLSFFDEIGASCSKESRSSPMEAEAPVAVKEELPPISHAQEAPPPEESPAHSPILLQALRAQPPVPVTISAASPMTASPRPLSVEFVPQPMAANGNGTTETPFRPSLPRLSLPNPSSSVLSPRFENNSGGRPIRSQRTPLNDIVVLDDPRELDEFMEQGEEGCIADMKTFINQYSLRQTTVAMMTGVSQPYISKLLNGNHRELSLRCRKNIYCWYLNCRRHPQKLAAFLADPASRLEANPDGELIPQRRERYVFRPILLRMLEGFFRQTPFPDLSRRVEMAAACNHVLSLDKNGVGLMPKEVVSPQVVANWFANKRKEIRRRTNTGQDQNINPALVAAANLIGVATSSQQPDEATSTQGSSPSPSPDSPDSFLNGQAPLDMVTLAQRLGITLPPQSQPTIEQTPKLEEPSLPSSSPESSPSAPPAPMVTLASQILAQNIEMAMQAQQHQQKTQPIVSLAQFMPQVTLSNTMGLSPFNLLANANLGASPPSTNGEFDFANLAMAYQQIAQLGQQTAAME